MAMAVSKAEAKEEVKDVFFSILNDNIVDEQARKRIKLDFENRIVDPSESPLERIDPIESKLDEIARTSYIFKKLKKFADKYPQLDVYDNKSAIVQRNFSKYSTSRPDITALINDVFIFNRDTHESFMVMADSEVDAEVDVETVKEDATKMAKKMNAMSLTVEAKLDEHSRQDPFGQLLAGMEKLYADLLFDQLKFVLRPGVQIPTDAVVMYGMCIIYESDRCILVKAELSIGVKTVVYKSRESLSIVDAFNRVLTKLLCL